jgi:hypothetical protein
MCRSIILLITWYLAIPLKEVVVPGYTPEGGGGTCYTPGGGSKPCAGASPCSSPGTWLYP